MKHFAVIGGGITGITTAYALLKRGHQVTVYEGHRYAAMETSYANGGQLSASNAEVWNSLPTVIKGLKWMFKKDAPLLVNPLPNWHKLSWFTEFLAAIPQHADNTTATARMAIAAREHLFNWADEEGIQFDLKQRGILHIYRDKQGFETAGKISRLLAAGGLERRAVTPEEMQAIEPALQGQYYGGYYTESDATGDIHLYTLGLAAACEKRGGVIRYQQQVEHLLADAEQVRIISRDASGQSEELTYDSVVICAGTASRALAAQVGDRLNIYPVKGYSITVALKDETSRSSAPHVSLLDEASKLVSSRLGDNRLRVAGTAEFNGYNRDIRADRIRPLVDWVQTCFPQISTEDITPWAGLRPMMPDMMPRVARGKCPSVYYNTGHGHLGWTLGAATAEMLADLVGE
ncbi:D-amino acid dehydrogenase [Marinospirillum alkaliphilum]|uniref:D-amino-acid dehydrogenase n=1 Tax=Marinospirillum alkaliphilum DSM 21637 TaxID=1122209 RepID=A0A1K1YHM4_9GAMM|nr:D-amino acid dehydrogenase [Marinospirillum alkaliphilum]SFX61408.1 D-amino-acid dehydrogenase [Marinospirillum alkaliphilum DSM 21637]